MKLNFKITLGTILFGILLSCFISYASPFNFSMNPENVDDVLFTKYYQLVDSIIQDSLTNQISALNNFLSQHPDFYCAYDKILERFLCHDKILDAERFFQNLSNIPDLRQNSVWMLGKIYDLQEDSVAAFRAFSQALVAGPLSIALLKDFVQFDYQHSGRFQGHALLRRLKFDQIYQKIAEAFYYHHAQNFKSAVNIFSKLDTENRYNTIILQVWGDCLRLLSAYDEADSLWHIGLDLAKKNGDLKAEAQFLSNLGVLQRARGKNLVALTYYDSAFAIADRIDDVHLIQLLAGNSANICYFIGDYNKAAEYNKTAIRFSLKMGLNNYATVWFKNYALVLVLLDQYYEALQALAESEKFAVKSNKNIQIIKIIIERAKIYSYLNQFNFARKLFEQARDLSKKHNLPISELRSSAGLAEIMIKEGKNYDRAREIFKIFIEVLNKNRIYLESAYCIRNLAKSYELEKRYDLARSYYLQAAETANKARSTFYYAWFLLDVVDLDLATGKVEDATKAIEIVKPIAEKLVEDDSTNINMISQVCFSEGKAHQLSGKLNEAIAAYRRSVGLIEKSRQKIKVEQLRIGYFSDKCQVYQKLVHCFFQLYEQDRNPKFIDSLYHYDQLAKGRALLDLRLSSNRVNEKILDSNHYHDYQKACKRLQKIQHRLRQKLEKYDFDEEMYDLKAKLEAARHSLIGHRLMLIEDLKSIDQTSNSLIPSLNTVREILEHKNLGLLSYHFSEDVSFALVVNADHTEIVKLSVNRETIAAAIDSLIKPLHLVKADSLQYITFRATIAYRLYQYLIEPLADQLSNTQELLVIPDNVLMGLPFELLLTKMPAKSLYFPSDKPSYSNDFLLNQYSILYLPNITFLQTGIKTLFKKPAILSYAYPIPEITNLAITQKPIKLPITWSFDPLPFAEIEQQTIKKFYSKINFAQGNHQVKDMFLEQVAQHQIIHFATHAFIDTTYDFFSGLVMTSGNDSTNDGLLMGYEISDKNLNCDLVTLSACETGCGKLIAGEGILGLPRSFLTSGAKTVLMTLWRVDDKFSSRLIPEFFHNFLNEGKSKSAALKQAKIELMNINEGNIYYQHPFFWASFCLYGEAGYAKTNKTAIIVFTLIIILALIIFTYLFRFFNLKRKSLLHPK